jgi:hypothetical protein
LWLTRHALRKGTYYRSRIGLAALSAEARLRQLTSAQGRLSVMPRMSKAWLRICMASFSSLATMIKATPAESVRPVRCRNEMDAGCVVVEHHGFGHGDPASPVSPPGGAGLFAVVRPAERGRPAAVSANALLRLPVRAVSDSRTVAAANPSTIECRLDGRGLVAAGVS